MGFGYVPSVPRQDLVAMTEATLADPIRLHEIL
ncbi:MAG: hypothetical protein JWL77_757 [Chthonomonadaceae bacterium]|nr:hypothetical protein [Chthonomonadaceae bacterium]